MSTILSDRSLKADYIHPKCSGVSKVGGVGCGGVEEERGGGVACGECLSLL
jgi:hypothetical protein